MIMKKIKLIVLVAISIAFFAQCSKDKSCPCDCPQCDTIISPDDPRQPEPDNILVGTSWKGSIALYEQALFEFENNSRVSVTLLHRGDVEKTIYGMYILSDRYISFNGLSTYNYGGNLCTFNSATFTNTIMTVSGAMSGESKTWTLNKL